MDVVQMVSDAWTQIASFAVAAWAFLVAYVPFVGHLAHEYVSHGFVWGYVITLGVLAVWNEFKPDERLSKVVGSMSDWFVVAVVAAWGLSFTSFGALHLEQHTQWGSHWYWAFAFAACPKSVAKLARAVWNKASDIGGAIWSRIAPASAAPAKKAAAH